MQDSVPFSERLAELLAARKQDGGQAWLARISGLEPSTVSRLLRGDRLPARETLELLAPALGISIDELVLGTTAAERARSGPDYVSIEQFREAVQKMLEFEHRANDAEARAKQLRDALDEQAARARTAEEATARAARLEKEKARLETEVRRHRSALDKAVADICQLNAQLADLKHLAESTGKTTTITAVLAGIAAVGGIVTAAYYLDKDEPQSGKGPKTEKKGKGA